MKSEMFGLGGSQSGGLVIEEYLATELAWQHSIIQAWRAETTDPSRSDLLKFVRDGKRLVNEEAFKDWLPSRGADRTFYAVRRGEGLAAWAWLAKGKALGGEKIDYLSEVNSDEISSYDLSFAARVYDQEGVKNLGLRLMKHLLISAFETMSDVLGVWVSTNPANIKAIWMNYGLGLSRVGSSTSDIYMAGSREEITQKLMKYHDPGS